MPLSSGNPKDRTNQGPEPLADAYLRTAYLVPSLALDLRIGCAHPALDELLARQGLRTWAFISAANPGSALLPDTENRSRAEQLQRMAAPWPHWPGHGLGLEGDWPPEESLLILGITREEALALGREFGQLAIVAGCAGGTAELCWC